MIVWKQKLGEEIERARRKKGWTQEQLGLAVELHLNTIGQYERGQRAPGYDDLRKIAVALQTDHFEVADNFRIEFNANGEPHLEPLPQQLNLFLDENNGVNVRIESAGQSLVIKKISA